MTDNWPKRAQICPNMPYFGLKSPILGLFCPKNAVFLRKSWAIRELVGLVFCTNIGYISLKQAILVQLVMHLLVVLFMFSP